MNPQMVFTCQHFSLMMSAYQGIQYRKMIGSSRYLTASVNIASIFALILAQTLLRQNPKKTPFHNKVDMVGTTGTSIGGGEFYIRMTCNRNQIWCGLCPPTDREQVETRVCRRFPSWLQPLYQQFGLTQHIKCNRGHAPCVNSALQML